MAAETAESPSLLVVDVASFTSCVPTPSSTFSSSDKLFFAAVASAGRIKGTWPCSHSSSASDAASIDAASDASRKFSLIESASRSSLPRLVFSDNIDVAGPSPTTTILEASAATDEGLTVSIMMSVAAYDRRRADDSVTLSRPSLFNLPGFGDVYLFPTAAKFLSLLLLPFSLPALLQYQISPLHRRVVAAEGITTASRTASFPFFHPSAGIRNYLSDGP